MNGLNEQQRRAVTAGDGPQLILAGAGSGKTRTIVHRIGHLIAERGLAPHRILAVTFTNKAAMELQERLSMLIGDGCGGVLAGTFHAISLRLLRRYADALGYPKTFLIIDADDQRALIKRLLKERNIASDRLHPQYLLGWIEHCKHAGLLPEQCPEQQWNGIGLHELYGAYQQELMRNERMDFSDLILNVVRLLREHAGIAEAIRARFDHVLVDEYQDTNPIQHEWLMLICSSHRNLTVVGDDDQSIYGWRGADVRHILDFARLWPKAGVHRLEYNYRSTAAILKLANAVIHENPERHDKLLRATREEGDRPRWLVCHDEFDEARRIASHLRSRRERGLEWKDMAVLYRSNRQSLPLEQVLRESSIPYRVIGGVGFFERMEVKDALSFWALVTRTADGMHLMRIANKPKRGIGTKGMERLADALGRAGMRAADWLDHLADSPSLTAPMHRLQPLARLVREVRERHGSRSDRGLWPILEQSGYLDSLGSLGELESAARVENLRALQNAIETAMEAGLTPVEFLDRASLLQSGEESDPGEDAVNLMSLHRAKGLEFDSVVLCGIEEGLLPHQRAIDEGASAVAEERRLLYVGITRARNDLLLTTTRVRRAFGEFIYPRPSRFIESLAPDVLDRVQSEGVPADVASPGVGLDVGQSVRHPTFGEGIVLGVEGSGEATRITVQFRIAGVKRLMLKYAALEPLSG
ncbi:MAG: DNA helicase II [Zetaproteobacteria bacterium]|nr:MAG: DNA helicase II [Zetaproteobacteria bacterium]